VHKAGTTEVKQGVFCREVSFFIKYKDFTSSDTKIRLAEPVQDGIELRNYIQERIGALQRSKNIDTIFTDKTQSMGVGIQSFVSDKVLQYSLFDNRLKKDIVRKAMYNIKDKYGKNIVRKGSELFEPHVMKDAIGFGSVRDMVVDEASGEVRNKYMLEEE
jgi:DNA polymerase IV